MVLGNNTGAALPSAMTQTHVQPQRGRDNVTGSSKTNHMGIFAHIELLVPSEFAFHCALIGTIDALIDACIAKVIAYFIHSTGETLFQDKTCFIAQ